MASLKLGPQKGAFRVAGAIGESCWCNSAKLQVQLQGVAGCEVVESHLAMFGSGRVRHRGVAPCDLFLIILRDFGGKGEVDANVLGVSGMGQTSVKVVCNYLNGLRGAAVATGRDPPMRGNQTTEVLANRRPNFFVNTLNTRNG